MDQIRANWVRGAIRDWSRSIHVRLSVQTAPPSNQHQSHADEAKAKARFELCRANLNAATLAGVLHDFDLKPGHDPYIVVGPAYASLRSSQKEELAQNLNCFMAAGKDRVYSFKLLNWRTEKPVADYSLGHLKPASE